MSLGERAALLRERSGLLGRWCVALERARDDFRRTEQESSPLADRLLARLVRLFFEFLVLGLIAVAELDMLWRLCTGSLRAGSILVRFRAVEPRE